LPLQSLPFLRILRLLGLTHEASARHDPFASSGGNSW